MLHRRLRNSASGLVLAGLVALVSACSSGPGGGSLRGDAPPPCAPDRITKAETLTGIAGTLTPASVLDEAVTALVDSGQLAGLSIAVINAREVVYSRSAGTASFETDTPVTGCTVFEGASITKPLFGHFVMTFVEEGRLDLDKPLYQYLPHPDLEPSAESQAMTARMVLSHQTGLPNWRSDDEERGLGFSFFPGTDFEYSGEGYQYLALVLQEIAGTDGPGLERLFQERIARPSGMARTQIIPSAELQARKAQPYRSGFVPAERWVYDDRFGAAYGVNSDAADFAAWAAAVLRREGLSEEGWSTFLTPQDVAVPQAPGTSQFGEAKIALGFFVYDIPGLGRVYMHDGNNLGFASIVVIHPETGWGFVGMTNTNRSGQPLIDLALFLNRPS
ncbi:MAG: serine hydrolase domain-containing protein [Pseudomonadota bacterium]